MLVRFLRKTNIEGVIRQILDLKEGLARKRGWCFWGRGGGGWHPNAHYVEKYILNITNLFLLKEIQYASKLLELI